MNGTHLDDGIPLTKQQIHQVAFTLPRTPDTTIHLHLTNLPQTLLLFFASTSTGAPSTEATLGSLVYALPNRNTSPNISGQPLSTPLYSRTSSIDFATRLARIMTRRTGKPVYVGGDVRFWDSDEEAGALIAIVGVVGKLLEDTMLNGQSPV